MAEPQKVVFVLTARHRPFEVLVLIITLLTGLLGLFDLRPTRTMNVIEYFLPGYAWIWYGFIILGAAVSLYSCFLTVPSALILERIGMTILVTFYFGYSFCALFLPAGGGISSALTLAGFGIAAAFRIRNLNKDIRILQTGVRNDS